MYINSYLHFMYLLFSLSQLSKNVYILQRGVQWKQGVVNYMRLHTSLCYNTTPIHCTPLPLHPPLLSIQTRQNSRNQTL